MMLYETNPIYQNNWADFFLKTSSYLQDKCDCYRDTFEPWPATKMMENRFFKAKTSANDPVALNEDTSISKDSSDTTSKTSKAAEDNDLHITYYQWMGDYMYPYGHWQPKPEGMILNGVQVKAEGYPESLPCPPGDLNCGLMQNAHNNMWKHIRSNVSDFLDMLQMLKPTPTHVIMENMIHLPIPSDVFSAF